MLIEGNGATATTLCTTGAGSFFVFSLALQKLSPRAAHLVLTYSQSVITHYEVSRAGTGAEVREVGQMPRLTWHCQTADCNYWMESKSGCAELEAGAAAG